MASARRIATGREKAVFDLTDVDDVDIRYTALAPDKLLGVEGASSNFRMFGKQELEVSGQRSVVPVCA